jgi:16S rRNA A1518/A1519 N6-dimethyltransferase RsmA/KsgA/DIM1 with predicted DNA glycosylase/AP lyase activity
MRPGTARRVLEIGTGCGYQAAVLSMLTKEVYSIERLRGLHEKARSHLRPMRLSNVHLILGDGMVGLPVARPMRASSPLPVAMWCRRSGAINWRWADVWWLRSWLARVSRHCW